MAGGDREAFKEVRNTLRTIEQSNSGLIRQLVLAKQENETLRRVAGEQAGISGGYDFMLTENTGIRIDDSTVVGVQDVGSTMVQVNLASAGNDRGQSRWLNAGESLAYTSARGQSCKVSLLSFQRGQPGVAAFANNCT